EFCHRVIHRGLGNAKSVYTYNSAGLELLRHAQERGVYTITEQTSAPNKIFRGIRAQEQENYRQWAVFQDEDPPHLAFEEREQMEWSVADLIVCGSEFVREGIRKMGGPVERCRVVPYGVRHPVSIKPRDKHHTPLRVLTVGAVRVMKGSQYLLAAARVLKGNAEF